MDQEDRLGAVMDHAARITADAAAANGLNLQDYIRRILKTYA